MLCHAAWRRLLVFDVTTTPMNVVATLNNNQIHPPVWRIQVDETMYINSGGGCRWRLSPMIVYALDLSNFRIGSAKLVLNGMTDLPIPTGWRG